MSNFKDFLNRIQNQEEIILKSKRNTLKKIIEIEQNLENAFIEKGFSETLQKDFWLLIVRNKAGEVILEQCAKSFEEAQRLKNQVYWQKEINRLEKEIWEIEERIKALQKS